MRKNIDLSDEAKGSFQFKQLKTERTLKLCGSEIGRTKTKLPQKGQKREGRKIKIAHTKSSFWSSSPLQITYRGL